ncbi:hypothetical protein H5410_046777 [Solanum commersonii]|uniref:Uncharacterized protein n=1 Tax=Solanum commersonii TaxID=4109 RepID=A0A9J5XFD1_SOLCO|nr:hypothetical protein H5410_046777 [Solanum commersonii]
MDRTSDAYDILKKIAVVNKIQLPPGKLVSSQLTEELLSPGKNKISSVKSGFSSLLVLFEQCQHLSIALHTKDDQSLYTNVLINSLAGAMLSPIVAVQLVRGCHQMAAIVCFEAVVVLSAASVLLISVETKDEINVVARRRKEARLTYDTRTNLAFFRSFTAADYVAAQRLR